MSPLKKKRRGKINCITQKLAGALDRYKCVRDSVFVLQAILEALGFNNDDYIINQISIHRAREIYRCERAKIIKLRFQKSRPSYVIIHWDGKLLPFHFFTYYHSVYTYYVHIHISYIYIRYTYNDIWNDYIYNDDIWNYIGTYISVPPGILFHFTPFIYNT